MQRNALKTAETLDGALAPALTAWDLRILRAVPSQPHYTDKAWSPAARGLDPWLVARAIRELDVRAVRSTLFGLYDRRLVTSVGYDTQRRYQRWVRTDNGDDYVEGRAHG
jgi:hypothetical protein